jgi:hypothetical protein
MTARTSAPSPAAARMIAALRAAPGGTGSRNRTGLREELGPKDYHAALGELSALGWLRLFGADLSLVGEGWVA